MSIPNDEFFQRMWSNWDGSRVTFTIRDETNVFRAPEKAKTVHAERVGPLAITDGAARPDRILWTWPMLWERLSPLERQLAHGPDMSRGYGKMPVCNLCPDEDWWPCPWAEDILQHFGLTKHDLDYRPGDERAAD